jgi:hypothetical protein
MPKEGDAPKKLPDGKGAGAPKELPDDNSAGTPKELELGAPDKAPDGDNRRPF